MGRISQDPAGKRMALSATARRGGSRMSAGAISSPSYKTRRRKKRRKSIKIRIKEGEPEGEKDKKDQRGPGGDWEDRVAPAG